MPKDLRSAKAKARDDWFASVDGRKPQDPGILREPSLVQYLRNRLESAFCAGWEAAKKSKRQ